MKDSAWFRRSPSWYGDAGGHRCLVRFTQFVVLVNSHPFAMEARSCALSSLMNNDTDTFLVGNLTVGKPRFPHRTDVTRLKVISL